MKNIIINKILKSVDTTIIISVYIIMTHHKPLVILFHMNGCPHCVRILEPSADHPTPIWTTIKKRLGNNVIVKDYETADSKDDLNGIIGKTLATSVVEDVKRRGYPTIVLVNKGKHMVFEGEIDVKPVLKFVSKETGIKFVKSLKHRLSSMRNNAKRTLHRFLKTAKNGGAKRKTMRKRVKYNKAITLCAKPK
jgi:thioredoxin-related protein